MVEQRERRLTRQQTKKTMREQASQKKLTSSAKRTEKSDSLLLAVEDLDADGDNYLLDESVFSEVCGETRLNESRIDGKAAAFALTLTPEAVISVRKARR